MCNKVYTIHTALINGFLCIFGLPFMHAVLPHSPLHVKCMADTEERVEGGYVRSIVVRVRETRLTNLFRYYIYRHQR